MASGTVTPSWYLSLALLTVPVKSYTAARDVRVELKNLHRECAEKGADAGLNILKRCSVCQAQVPESDIIKGYRDGDGYTFNGAPVLATVLDGQLREASFMLNVLYDIPLTEQVAPNLAPIDARGHRTFGGRPLEGTPGVDASMLATHRVGDVSNLAHIEAWAREIATALTTEVPSFFF